MCLKILLMKLLWMAIALLEIPVSRWTCLRIEEELTISVLGKVCYTPLYLLLLLLLIGMCCSFHCLLGCLCAVCQFGGVLGSSGGWGFSSRVEVGLQHSVGS